jgi:zinc/manganese transport system ATP-binding protein
MTDQDAALGTSDTLVVDGVCVRLSGREVLHDVGFTIRAGEFTGLIGSNGAGKTTLLRVILGLQAPASGTVEIAGRPRSRGSQLTGYVPQRISLDPEMPLRARDLVGLGLDGHRLGLPLPSARRRRQVDDMLDAVDARRFADERVGNLSGGEQQRVLIAHALISRPRLLLLDEPLANLDIRSERSVIALLARIAREQQIAVLISAHEMNPLLPVMDRIVYMAGGRAASGTTEEVVRPDVLSKLYGQHVDVIRIHDRILVVAGQGNGPDPAPEHEEHAPQVEHSENVEHSAAFEHSAAVEHSAASEHSEHSEHSHLPPSGDAARLADRR